MYKYLADGYIQNVWAGEPQERNDAVVTRCHWFSSLKANKVYVVHWVVRKSDDVLSVSCTCCTGEACNLIAALMLYMEDFMRQSHSDLPTDTTATGTCSNGMSSLSVMFLNSLWKASCLGRPNMVSVVNLSVIATACTPQTPNLQMTMHRCSS